MELKQLVQEESVCFYVSPFRRSRQTYEQLRQSFNDEQVHVQFGYYYNEVTLSAINEVLQ